VCQLKPCLGPIFVLKCLITVTVVGDVTVEAIACSLLSLNNVTDKGTVK
jgi:hypothetical protein